MSMFQVFVQQRCRAKLTLLGQLDCFEDYWKNHGEQMLSLVQDASKGSKMPVPVVIEQIVFDYVGTSTPGSDPVQDPEPFSDED